MVNHIWALCGFLLKPCLGQRCSAGSSPMGLCMALTVAPTSLPQNPQMPWITLSTEMGMPEPQEEVE